MPTATAKGKKKLECFLRQGGEGTIPPGIVSLVIPKGFDEPVSRKKYKSNVIIRVCKDSGRFTCTRFLALFIIARSSGHRGDPNRDTSLPPDNFQPQKNP